MRTVVVFAFALAPLLFALGCKSEDQAVQIRTENKQNLMRLEDGMTREQVMEIMGDKTVTVGMGKSSVSVTNPHSRKTITVDGKEYEVLYYYTDFQQADYPFKKFKVLDADLTPVVFEDGKLIGWGRDFLTRKTGM